MSESSFRKPFAEWKKRLWSKNRKPWEGERDAVEALRSAMWKSVFELSDKIRYGYTVAELGAACKVVLIESVNHGGAEIGHGNPYDRDRIDEGIDKLYHEWMVAKARSINPN